MSIEHPGATPESASVHPVETRIKEALAKAEQKFAERMKILDAAKAKYGASFSEMKESADTRAMGPLDGVAEAESKIRELERELDDFRRSQAEDR